MLLRLVAKFLNLSMEVVENLKLYVVKHDALKSLLLYAHLILMWMVEKVELDHLVSELKRTFNPQDSTRSHYLLGNTNKKQSKLIMT